MFLRKVVYMEVRTAKPATIASIDGPTRDSQEYDEARAVADMIGEGCPNYDRDEDPSRSIHSVTRGQVRRFMVRGTFS